ncbi:MAG: hypothetical protein AB8B55_16100 [Mariniblastus sp.]
MESEIQRIELLRDKLTAQNEKVLENATRHLPQVTPQIRIVNIPTGRSNISPLSVERIEEYKNFLKQIISEASKLSQDFEVTDSGERKAQKDLLKSETLFERNKNLHIVSDELCGICKGGCCANGQEHAYITASTIRRFMNENPSLDAAEVLDSYVGKLEKETAEESCINQTKTGCGLPREMRSDSCNAYFCQELRNLHDEVNKQPITETGLLAVQRPYIHWDRESEDACTDVTSAHFVSTEDVIPVEISDIEN